MGVRVRLERLSAPELLCIFRLPGDTDELFELRRKAFHEWYRRLDAKLPTGRWHMLVWFAQGERIMSHDELDEALAGYGKTRADLPRQRSLR